MECFDIGLAFMIYSAVATIFAALILKKEDNILGRAFIWPIILLVAMVKAIMAEFEDWTKTVKK